MRIPTDNMAVDTSLAKYALGALLLSLLLGGAFWGFRKNFSASSLLNVPPPTINLEGRARTIAGTPLEAFVWSWSERGNFVSARADSNGEFKLLLTRGDRWHIGGAKDLGDIYYKSTEIILYIDGARLDPIELVFTKLTVAPRLQAVSARGTAAEEIIALVPEGAGVRVPSGATISVGEGPFAAYVDSESPVTVEIRPTVEVPGLASARVVGLAYDIALKNEAGQNIQDLQQDIEVRLPYRDEELLRQGVNENEIWPSFFDEAKNNWTRIDPYRIDVDKNTIFLSVRHLTRFAIVAATDITPPRGPSAVSAYALGGGKIGVEWENPSRDFGFAKVYRSEKEGKLGQMLLTETAGSGLTDEGVKDGVVYYYTVRAVDPAGNESVNTNQMSARAVGTSPPKKTLPQEEIEVRPEIAKETPPALAPPPPIKKAPEPQTWQEFFWRMWQAIVSFWRE